MSHQQKLVHIQEIDVPAMAGALVINTLFHIDDVTQPDSYHVARHEVTVECIGGDPGADFRWWTTAVGLNSFTFNWDFGQRASVRLRIVAHIFHSICFDISTAQPPY